ncbi:retrovirus-related pol polyprotein from transposon TNT 1-94 [Tanacetum coccineum]|uniref:Retrovirus-related pol polyprotein from transposon TNT 1-94 n=1 Tax=Tanacetum coccineum TaxID=301880 RepID=A0ABQ5F9P0_9ASTR
MEDEVDQCYVAKKSFEIEKKQLLINNDRLLEENIASDIMCTYLRSLNEVDNCGKCKSLDIVLLDLQESNKSLCELRKHFAKLEEYNITLDIAFQNHKEQMILNDPETKNKQFLVKTINNQYVKINDLKVQFQDKLHVINELKHLLAQKSQKTQCELPVVDSRIQKKEDENVSLAFQVIPKVVEKKDLLKSATSHLTTNKIIEKCTKVLAPGLLKIESEPINEYFKNNRVVHRDYLKVTKEHVGTLQKLLEEARELKPLDEHMGHASKFAKRIQELLVYVSASCPFTQSGNEKWAPATSHKKNYKPYVDASRMKQTIETITQKHAVKQNTRKTDNTILPSIGRVSSTNAYRSKPRSNTKNDRIPQSSSRSMNNKVESLHRKFKSSANKNNYVKNVALSKNSDTICLSWSLPQYDLDGNQQEGCLTWKEKIIQTSPATIVPLGNRLHTIRIPVVAPNAETRMRYSIAKNSLIRAHINSYGHPFNPPNFSFVRNYAIPARSSWKFGFLGIVEIVLWYLDYGCSKNMTGHRDKLINFVSKFIRTVKFFRTKDEAPEIIIKFLKQAQVSLNATVRYLRTDNGTEFLNQTLRNYTEEVGITHNTSTATYHTHTSWQGKKICSLLAGGFKTVVERRNRTLVEAARTMLIFSKSLLFLWVEAVATACYTQNRSLIHTRYNKTPYELLRDRKPELKYLHIFCALCYPINDFEDLGKL